MPAQPDTAIVRILTGAGKVIGAGFLVDAQHVMTCAHMVNSALGRSRSKQDRPTDMVRLDFPLIDAARGSVWDAQVVTWKAQAADGSGDMAVLRLQDAAPPEANPVTFGTTAGNMWGTEVRTFGFPGTQPNGAAAEGELRMRQGNGWLQVDARPKSAFFVEPGFSGAPGWGEDGRVFGMVVTADLDNGRRAAFLIPAETLADVHPTLKTDGHPTPRDDGRGKSQHVFISYARKDGSDEAERLYHNLSAQHIDAWRDTRDLDPYADFGGEIEQAIIDATHVAVCVTPDVSRLESFVRREIAFALEEKKPIIPLMFPGGRCPITIINHTRIDFTDWDTGFAALMERLERGVEEITPETRREMERAYLQAVGQRYDHWRDLYTDMAATARIEKPKVKPRTEAAARYLEMQHAIFTDRDDALTDDRSKTVTVQSFDELREGIHYYGRVALIGDPGAGKTTTLERLAYELATDAAEDEHKPLSLFVRLGAYESGDFDKFLEDSFGGLTLSDYLPGRVFLLLDGLNEMPPEHAPLVDTWLRANTDTPTIVTCRKLDYVGHKLPLQRIDVAPLDVRRIHLFIHNYLEDDDCERLFWAASGAPTREAWAWFQGKVEHATFDDFWFGEQEPGYDWEPEHKQLKAVRQALAEQGELPGMLGVVSNPFLLFITVRIYTDSGELPANLGQLFDRFVTLLMDQRGKPASRTRPPWINEHTQRRAFAALAYRMQAERTGTSVEADWACRVIQEALPGEDAEQLLYLAASASIIESGKTVRFVHQRLQEYFAAYEMGEDLRRGVPATKYWPGDRWWEPTVWDETALLLAGIEEDATEVVRWLTPVQPTLAYRCATESGAQCAEEALQPLYDPILPPMPKYETGDEIDRWRKTLPRITPLARAAWGRVLAERGDTRRGVGLRQDGLPHIDWVEIPAGPFLMGSTDAHVAELKARYDWDWPKHEKPQRTITLPAFYIARYPVSYSQFEVFVKEGYHQRGFWTEAGWEDKGSRTEPSLWDDPQWHISNHPVIGVTWYEAWAFTQWLSARLGYKVRLPTGSEWEKAARGTDGRIFPWGDEYIPGYANTDETDPKATVGPYYVRRTTAGGMYPQGASPYGALDMSGNVWEWCLSKWRDEYHFPEDNDPEGNAARVLRGGSWFFNVLYARCAFRSWFDPDGGGDIGGFRVVCSAPI